MELRVVQNVEIVDLLQFIDRKKKLHQRLLLEELETILDRNSEEYKTFRKSILDNTNDYTRSVVKVIFGDTYENYMSK